MSCENRSCAHIGSWSAQVCGVSGRAHVSHCFTMFHHLEEATCTRPGMHFLSRASHGESRWKSKLRCCFNFSPHAARSRELFGHLLQDLYVHVDCFEFFPHESQLALLHVCVFSCLSSVSSGQINSIQLKSVSQFRSAQINSIQLG